MKRLSIFSLLCVFVVGCATMSTDTRDIRMETDDGELVHYKVLELIGGVDIAGGPRHKTMCLVGMNQNTCMQVDPKARGLKACLVRCDNSASPGTLQTTLPALIGAGGNVIAAEIIGDDRVRAAKAIGKSAVRQTQIASDTAKQNANLAADTAVEIAEINANREGSPAVVVQNNNTAGAQAVNQTETNAGVYYQDVEVDDGKNGK